MRNGNYDISLEYTAMITAVAELFKNTMSIHDLETKFDIPKIKALIQGKLRNIQDAREASKTSGSPYDGAESILDQL